jgi:hypothetical protein
MADALCGPREDDRLPTLTGLDGDFDQEDLWKALKGMKTHRAPGGDGIPTDFYRAALKEKLRFEEWVAEQRELGPDDDPDPPPDMHMSEALVDLVNSAWTTGTIVDDWTESIVISLLKKRDLTDPGNYQGISLMSTCLKIVCVILSDRINSSAEAAKRLAWLRPFSAGTWLDSPPSDCSLT